MVKSFSLISIVSILFFSSVSLCMEEDLFSLTNFTISVNKSNLKAPFCKDKEGNIHYTHNIDKNPQNKITSLLSTLVCIRKESFPILEGLAHNTNFMNFFPILKSNVQENLDLSTADKILNLYRQEAESQNNIVDLENDYVPERFKNEKFYEDLSLATQKIDNLDEIQDGDTLVVVGNTPQLIYEAHKLIGKKKLNYIKVAISGTPGKYKEGDTWYESILITEKGVGNYREYLKKVGFINNNHTGNIFFIDIISSGMGIKFLKNALVTSQNVSSKIYMLGINSLEQWADAFKNEKDIEKCLSLDMSELATQLDQIPNRPNHPLRLMPRLPSYMWENMDINSLINVIPGKEAEKIIKNISEFSKKDK